MKIYKYILLLFCVFLNVYTLSSQNNNLPNFSTIKVDQLSDDQVRSFIQQIQSSGLSDAQLEQVAKSRGMKPEEIVKLRNRVEQLKLADQNKLKKVNLSSLKGDNTISNDSLKITTDTIMLAEKALLELKSKIFGSNLFKNKQLSFEPALRLTAPANYQIGPDDVLGIQLYGYSEVNYSLKVSPEGYITVPNVGLISLLNLTIEQAIAKLKSKMSSIYLGLKNGKTNLNVTLENIRSVKIIIAGEVEKPGSFTIPSVSSIINALYLAGGPTENGSFRDVQVVRSGKIIAKVDLYDFLINGELKTNIRLQDQDVILVPSYKNRVEVIGQVKRPVIFETLEGECLNQLLSYAGGFTENAFQNRLKIIRNTNNEKQIIEVEKINFNTFKIFSGDKIYVDEILDRYLNRVIITGAVFRPGQYQLDSNLTVRNLLIKAQGVREDAFLDRASIKRLKKDLQIELLSFNIGDVINGKAPDIELKREDIVTVSSIFDLKEEYKISVYGQVVHSDTTMPYFQGMTLADAIVLSGGFKDAASLKKISVSRRVKNSDSYSVSALTGEVFELDVEKNLITAGSDFKLEPFDIIVVRKSAGYEEQRQIKIEGEVVYPGLYTITRKDERISDFIKRAGGFTALAYPEGAYLKRGIKKSSRSSQTSNADSAAIIDPVVESNELVGIELKSIMENPKTIKDLFIEEGDNIFVPKQLQTVTVKGQVLSPVTTPYVDGKGLGYYISSAGGFAPKAFKRRVFVRYANGATASTKKILFVKFSPKIKQGSEIFVPENPNKRPLSINELIGVTTSILTLFLLIRSIN